MVLCIQFWVKDDFQSRSDWEFSEINFEFSQTFGMVKLKILSSDNSIARFYVQGIEVFTFEEHSRIRYLHRKKELSSGHTLEYGYFEDRRLITV